MPIFVILVLFAVVAIVVVQMKRHGGASGAAAGFGYQHGNFIAAHSYLGPLDGSGPSRHFTAGETAAAVAGAVVGVRLVKSLGETYQLGIDGQGTLTVNRAHGGMTGVRYEALEAFPRGTEVASARVVYAQHPALADELRDPPKVATGPFQEQPMELVALAGPSGIRTFWIDPRGVDVLARWTSAPR